MIIELQSKPGAEIRNSLDKIFPDGFIPNGFAEKVDETGQGHDIWEVCLLHGQTFHGYGTGNCIEVGALIWRNGIVRGCGDEKSVVHGQILAIDPQTKIATIAVSSCDRYRFNPPIIVNESVEIVDDSAGIGTISKDGWRISRTPKYV